MSGTRAKTAPADRCRARGLRLGLVAALLLAALVPPAPAWAFESRVLDSVVSVLPTWPGYAKPGLGAPTGSAPEGTAVAMAPGGYLATALHVVARAERIEVRLGDGRRLPAELAGADPATDLALLKIAADLPLLPPAPAPALGQPVCAVGNAFGLDLSVSCGVVSALRQTAAGFNAVEDFLQTDAAVNPGASGGALVDHQGRFVGLLSAIFTAKSDANVGVNFAVSQALTRRVVDDLVAEGRVRHVSAGWRIETATPQGPDERPGARIVRLLPGGAAGDAGLLIDDVIVELAGRPVRKGADVTTAVYLQRPGDRVAVTVRRDGDEVTETLELQPR